MLPVQRNKDIKVLVDKLAQRVQKLNEVEEQFIGYIVKLQYLYENYGGKISKEIVNFQQELAQVSLYSSQKCGQIVKFAKVLRELCLSVRNNAEVNLLNLKRVDKQKVTEQEVKLKRKSESFNDELTLYTTGEHQHNRIYTSYQAKCSSLDEILSHFRDYSNPINFYNESATEEYLKDLENRYATCTAKESEILTDRQVLDQKRKWLGQHLKQVTESYVLLLHHHLVRMENVSSYVTDCSKDRRISNASDHQRAPEENDSQDYQMEELERLDKTYKKKLSTHEDQDILSDFSALFNSSVQSKDLSPDYKFFHDRCLDFGKKKLKNASQTLQLRNKFVKQLNKISNKLLNFDKDFTKIQKEVYGINRADHHKKRYRKYFGQNFSQIQQLCFTIIERPRRAFLKISVSIKSQCQRLNKICLDMDQSIMAFEKRMNHIFDEHGKIKAKVEALPEIDNETFLKYKSNIVSSFHQFKVIIAELEKADKQASETFNTGILSLARVISHQIYGKSLSKIIQKEANRLNILKTINIDSQVIGIIKQDTRYEILFSEALKPNLSITFTSLIERRKYEQTLKVLQKKQIQSRNMLRKKFGCCGITNQPITYATVGKFECQIQKDKHSIYGKLYVLQTGLRFKQKTYNFFKKNVQLLIPSKEITAVDKKISVQKSQQMIIVETTMGHLTFLFLEANQAFQQIQKTIQVKPKQLRDRSIDHRDKRNQSCSSSFVKMNTSTEYKLSFDLINPNQTKKHKAGSQPQMINETIKSLSEKLKKEILFSPDFAPSIKQTKQDEPIRINYDYVEGGVKFKVKEKRELNISPMTNFLLVNYEWKVSFPEFQMLNSFRYHEKARIEVSSKSVKVLIETGILTDQTQFLKRKFIDQVNRMNEKLTQIIMNHCEREVQVVIEKEANKDNFSSELILIDDIDGPNELKIDLSEIQDKSPTFFRRMSPQPKTGSQNSFRV